MFRIVGLPEVITWPGFPESENRGGIAQKPSRCQVHKCLNLHECKCRTLLPENRCLWAWILGMNQPASG
jgi:hypothetical protein